MEEELDAFVGIDWGTEDYEVCCLDGGGRKLGARVFGHSGEGLEALAEWLLSTLEVPADRVAVAIEIKRGAVITHLLEKRFHVFLCNPKQTDRLRDRYSLAGAKSDPLDAFVLADAARKDRAQLRAIEADDPRVIPLRELTRQHADLTERRVELENKLRQQLHRYFPQMSELKGDVAARWKLELLERAPTPTKARRLRLTTLEQLLKKYHVRRYTAAQVRAVFRSRTLQVAGGVTEAAVIAVRILVPQLRLIHTQLHEVDRQIDRALERFDAEAPGQESEQRDVAILKTLPGAGRIVIATLLAEAHPALEERDYHRLRLATGVAPITQKSGKQGRRAGGPRAVVQMRRACSQRLRNATFYWARGAIVHDLHWREQASILRARGLSVGATNRVIADRLLRVATACLRDGESYRPKDTAAAAAAAA